MRLDIQTRTAAILAQGPAYLASRSLADFNAEAAKQQKAGEHAAAVATYLALFAKAQHANLTHPELYVCHSNCAAAYLKLGLFQEALRHANKCQTLAETSLRRWVAWAHGWAAFPRAFDVRLGGQHCPVHLLCGWVGGSAL